MFCWVFQAGSRIEFEARSTIASVRDADQTIIHPIRRHRQVQFMLVSWRDSETKIKLHVHLQCIYAFYYCVFSRSSLMGGGGDLDAEGVGGSGRVQAEEEESRGESGITQKGSLLFSPSFPPQTSSTKGSNINQTRKCTVVPRHVKWRANAHIC